MSDLFFEDKGTTGSVGTWSGDSNFDITTDGMGTLLRCKSGKTWVTRTPSPTSSFNVGYNEDLGTDVGFGISLNILDISNAYIKFTNVTGGEKRVKLNKTGKHVVTISSTGIYLDGVLQENTAPTSNTSQISIQLQNTSDYIKYHDLQIYKISEKRFHYANTLHNVRFYDKEDITGVSGNNNKPGLLKDKTSIRINVNQIDDFPNSMTPTSHKHGDIENNGVIANQGNKNVVTDANGKIVTENKPTIPQANTSASVLKADGSASAGTNNNYARADHIHPKDSSKADTSHIHGYIDSNGVLRINGVAQENMNIITDENGKITASRLYNIPSPSDRANDIKMNGNNANAGVLDEYARVDHIHPHDTLLNEKADRVHTHGLINQNGVISNQANKNVVTNGQGAITTEEKPTIPQANTVASNIQANGTRNAGSLSTFARADHIHPSDSTKANANHVHGFINSDGIISNQGNKNVVTDSNGKITTENKIDYSGDINNINTLLAKLSQWVDATTHISYSGTSVQTNSNIRTCLVNEALGLCFIRIEYPSTTKNAWANTNIVLPASLGPVWRVSLTCTYPDQAAFIEDDDHDSYPRRIRYYNKGDKDIVAHGLFFVSGGRATILKGADQLGYLS